MQGNDHHMAVLPGSDRRRFLIIDQGNIIGELGFDEQFECVFNQTNLSTLVIEQLYAGIKSHY
jgi:streptomycin 6-kinase